MKKEKLIVPIAATFVMLYIVSIFTLIAIGIISLGKLADHINKHGMKSIAESVWEGNGQ